MSSTLTATTQLDENHLTAWQDLVDDVIRMAQSKGATAVEVNADFESGFDINVRLGDVETLAYQRDRSVGVTVYFGQAKGSATTSDLTPAALQNTVEAACNIARHTDADPYAGLAEPGLLAFHYPDLDLYHPWAITPEQAIALALECESLARQYDPRITNSEGVSLATHQACTVYGNSHHFIGAYRYSRHSMGCSLLAQDGRGMQRDDDFTVGRAAEDLQSPAQLAKQTAERVLRRLGGRRLSTRQAPVIFTANVASSLLSHFLAAIRGQAQYRKASFLLDHIGQSIFPKHINIYQRPHLLKGLASSPFDADGVSTADLDYIRDGILNHYLLSVYSARKLAMTTTGNAGGVYNLFIDTSDADFSALIKQMDTGLVVTELLGQGVNIVTGDYSRGAAGFWVERGEIQYPVEEITIAGNLRDMFAHLVAVGNDVDRRGNIQTGSILLEQMTIAGE